MTAPAAHPPRILFVATEDWFFCSHFLPMARAARDAGFEVIVAARERAHRPVIEAEGFRLVPVEAERRSLNPLAMFAALWRLRGVIREADPAVVHLIALRSIILGGVAARLAGARRRVVALTGMGFLGAGRTAAARTARALVTAFIRGVVDGPQVRFLFENRSDPVMLGLDPDTVAKVTVVGGAGVDPDRFSVMPQPPHPPLRVAMIARMLWSKGPDLAVAAVKLARARGADVTLDLYGAPDASNPKAISAAMLADWATLEGIAWHGPTADIAGVWAAHHLAILPSRGGEGLPRTLLESAACGRAMLTTDVPGCRDFVRDGIDGVVVPADEAEPLADALVRLASDPSRVAAMGDAARERLLDGHTEAAVGAAVVRLYRSMLA